MKKYPKVNFAAILLLVLVFCSNNPAQENSKQAEASRLLNEATKSLKEKKFDETIEKTTRVLEMFPKSGDVYVIRAMAYQAKSEKEKAIADFSRALTANINPELELMSHKMRGMLLYQTNKFAGAIRDFDFAVSKNPSDFKNFAFRGWSYFYIGSYREAIEDFDSVLKLSPNETTFRRFRGLAYYFLDNYEKTVDDITEELKINDNPQIENYKIRANAYRKLGKNDLAEKDEKKYAEMGGDLSEIVIEKPVNVSVGTFVYDTEKVKSIRQSIYQSINEKNFDGAFKEVEELIKNVPTPENINLKSLIFTARGANYFKLGEYQKALEDLNEALKLNAGSHLAYQGRAAAYRKLGRIKEAEADEAKYEELKPKAP